MPRCMKVFCRVAILRGVATTDMTAYQTHPQVHPVITRLQAFFAALRPRLDIADLVEMGAVCHVCALETLPQL